MSTDIKTLGFDLTDAIRRHVEGRMEWAMKPYVRRIIKITARLDDVNADHGGIDKRCSVVVALRRRGVATAQVTCADLYTAVNHVAARIRRAVERTVKRPTSRERKDRQRPGTLVTV
jgi:putative sigma-54 modulation protein